MKILITLLTAALLSGTPAVAQVTPKQFAPGAAFSNLGYALTAPGSSSATCSPGQQSYDGTYVYLCTATNTWGRALTSDFSGNVNLPGALTLGTALSVANGGIGGTTAATGRTNLGGYWRSPKDYGAVCNTVADDTAAIQSALNAGGWVQIPPGCVITSTVTMTVGGTHLVSSGASWGSLTSTVVAGDTIAIQCFDCSVERMRIFSTAVGPTSGCLVDAFGYGNIRVQNVRTNAGWNGICMSSFSKGSISAASCDVTNAVTFTVASGKFLRNLLVGQVFTVAGSTPTGWNNGGGSYKVASISPSTDGTTATIVTVAGYSGPCGSGSYVSGGAFSTPNVGVLSVDNVDVGATANDDYYINGASQFFASNITGTGGFTGVSSASCAANVVTINLASPQTIMSVGEEISVYSTGATNSDWGATYFIASVLTGGAGFTANVAACPGSTYTTTSGLASWTHAGIELVSAGGEYVTNATFGSAHQNVLFDPGAGQNVFDGFWANIESDNATGASFTFNGTTTAACGIRFDGSIGSLGTDSGVWEQRFSNIRAGFGASGSGNKGICTFGSFVAAIDVTNFTANVNDGGGVYVKSGNYGMHFGHGEVLANGVATSAPGVEIAGGFGVMLDHITSTKWFPSNGVASTSHLQNYGYLIDAGVGASGTVSIVDSDCGGLGTSNNNTVACLLNNSSSTHIDIERVNGYNPKGITTPALPASTVAYQNGATPATAHLTGGTCTVIQISGVNWGTTCADTAVPLPAGGTMTVTYTVAPNFYLMTQ